MNFDDEDFATYYPGRYIRKRDKKGRFYYRDRDTGKPVSKKTWEQERLTILEAVERRKKEKEEGKKPETRVPVWISPKKRAKKETIKKKKERDKKWEEERKRQAKEIKEARERLKRIEKEYREEQEKIRKKIEVPGPPEKPPAGGGVVKLPEGVKKKEIEEEFEEAPEEPEFPEEPIEMEEIDYFDVDEVTYSTEK